MAQVMDVPVSWFFAEDLDARALPDDLFDILTDHDNLEILLAVHRIGDRTTKRQIMTVINAFAELADGESDEAVA